MRRLIFQQPTFDNSIPFASALETDSKEVLSHLCHILDSYRDLQANNAAISTRAGSPNANPLSRDESSPNIVSPSRTEGQLALVRAMIRQPSHLQQEMEKKTRNESEETDERHFEDDTHTACSQCESSFRDKEHSRGKDALESTQSFHAHSHPNTIKAAFNNCNLLAYASTMERLLSVPNISLESIVRRIDNVVQKMERLGGREGATTASPSTTKKKGNVPQIDSAAMSNARGNGDNGINPAAAAGTPRGTASAFEPTRSPFAKVANALRSAGASIPDFSIFTPTTEKTSPLYSENDQQKGGMGNTSPLSPTINMSVGAALECWVCVFLWLRKAAIQMLRTLARTYSEHQWCLKYWMWAERHPYQLELHHLFSLKFSTHIPISIHRRSQCLSNIAKLAHHDNLMIESIGVIHSAVMAMNETLADLGRVFSAHGDDEEEDAFEVYKRDEMVFVSVARRFIRSINQAPACSEAHGISYMASFSTDRPASCWSEVLGELSAATSRCHAFAAKHRAQLAQQGTYPPVGRNWMRMVAAAMVATPVAYYGVRSLRSEEAAAQLKSVYESLASYFQSWAWAPAKAALRALTHVRPDAEHQRQYLEAEKDLTAKVVSDFIKDRRPNITPEELHVIEEAARNGDLSAIHQAHADAVKRPIYNFLFGPLVRLMLIQLQQQKMAVTGVLISTDEVLESNDFNFKMLALAPVVLGVWGGISAFATYRKSKKGPLYSRLKICWRDLSRLLEQAEGSGVAERQTHSDFLSNASSSPPTRSPTAGYPEGNAGISTTANHSTGEPVFLRSPVMSDTTAPPNFARVGFRNKRPTSGFDTSDENDEYATQRRGSKQTSKMLSPPPHIPSSIVSSGGQRELSPTDQGRALLIVHEMRGLCDKLSDYPLLPQLMEDLADVEAANSSRAKRLRALGRMMSTHPILQPTFMPLLK